MKDFIERQAQRLVEDLEEIAEEIHECEVTGFDECARVIWEDGDTKDIAQACNACGRLAMLEAVARRLEIYESLSEKTKERFKWQTLIDPA